MKTRTRSRRYKNIRKHKNTRTINIEGNLPPEFQGIRNEAITLSNPVANQKLVEPQPSTSSCRKENISHEVIQSEVSEPQPTSSS